MLSLLGFGVSILAQFYYAGLWMSKYSAQQMLCGLVFKCVVSRMQAFAFFCVIFIQRIDHDKCCIYTYIPLSKCCCFSVIFIQHIDHDKCCIYTYIPFPKCCFSVMTAKLNICFHLVSEADPAILFDWLPKRRPTKKTNKDFCLPKITKVYIS